MVLFMMKIRKENAKNIREKYYHRKYFFTERQDFIPIYRRF